MRPHRLPLGLAIAALLLAGLLARAPAAGAVGVWAPAAAPPTRPARGGDSPSLLRLQDGRLLLVVSPAVVRPGADAADVAVYDPAADRWAARAPMPAAQGDGAPVLLRDGRVLVTGGEACAGSDPGTCAPLAAAQIYDPAADTWTPVAPMHTPRHGHTATLLPDGTVLVAGGDVAPAAEAAVATNAAERYDPRTDRWSPAAPLAATRVGHTATPLRDGRVLVVGGISGGARPGPVRDARVIAAAERYDPAADRWTPAASMTAAWRGECCGQTATALADGRVLVTGKYQPTAEVYDPAADRWADTGPMTAVRAGYTVTPLPDGRVLAAGGLGYSPAGAYLGALASTEVYDPARNAWAGAAPLTAPRAGAVAAALADGRVLVVGGTATPSAEVYTPAPGPAACFAETGQCVRAPFLAYWLAHGGLAVNGYPLGDEFIQVLDDGKAYQVQYFERVRLEYHPDNPAPWDIELGQFGRQILQERTGQSVAPPAQPKDGSAYFRVTGHNVAPDFSAYWQANGGLAQFGYPLTEEFQEQLEDGKTYTVQYFERARFERHPENQPPWDIELGQFGRQILAESVH